MIRRGAVLLAAAVASLAVEALAQSPPDADASRNELTQSNSQLSHVNPGPADAARADVVHVDAVQADASHPDSEPGPTAPPTAHSKPQPEHGNPLWSIPINDLSATRERPLFSVSRRPRPVAAPQAAYVPPPPVLAPAAPEHPLITLVGTVLRGTRNVAIFTDPTGQTAIHLHVGEEDNGWVVRSVGLRTTVLEKDNQQVTLTLPVPNPQPIGAAPTASDTATIEPVAGGRRVLRSPSEAP